MSCIFQTAFGEDGADYSVRICPNPPIIPFSGKTPCCPLYLKDDFMASFDEPGRVRREGLLARLLRFLGLGHSKKEKVEHPSINLSAEQAAGYFDSGKMAFYDFSDGEISEILILSQPEGLDFGELETSARIDGKIKKVHGKSIRPTAYIWSDGTLRQDSREIMWLEDGAGNLPPAPFEPLTVYRIRVRKAPSLLSDSNLLLVEVVEGGIHDTRLEDVREEYLHPVWYTHSLGSFKLDKIADEFEARLEWAGQSVLVCLDADPDSNNEKPYGHCVKWFEDVFARRTHYRTLVDRYLSDHIRKNDGIRTDTEFFPNPYPTPEKFFQALKLQNWEFYEDDFSAVFYNGEEDEKADFDYYFRVTFDQNGNIALIES